MVRTNVTRERRRRLARSRYSRVRCRVCYSREATRFCPGVNNHICPACCAKMRPRLAACPMCKYYLYTLATSREVPEPEPKFYNAYISDSEKSGILNLAMAWEKPDGRLKAMFLLLDFWKAGLKNCFVSADIGKEEFEQRVAAMGGLGAKKVNVNDAKKLVKRGIYISNAVGTPIPWEYQRWKYLLGDMSNIPDPTGSIYKCARCGADLSAPLVDVIKKNSQAEDVHFYIVCGKCAGEFED